MQNTPTHLSDLPGGELLGPSAGLPLLQNTGLLERLLDSAGSGTTGELGDGVRGEDEVSVSELLTGDRGGRSVDQSLEVSFATK